MDYIVKNLSLLLNKTSLNETNVFKKPQGYKNVSSSEFIKVVPKTGYFFNSF